MNKTELIDAVATSSGLARSDAAKAVDSFLATVATTLASGEDVAITGFGKFAVTHRNARTGRNPATGAMIQIKASKTPKFTPGATFKATVAGA